MASNQHPLAIFAQQDAARAQAVLQGIGCSNSAVVSQADLIQSTSQIGELQSQIAAANPIILLVSAGSANSILFQSIALFAQQGSKRLIIIDLDETGQANIGGSLKHFGDCVISASDPGISEVLDSPDRWTLPDGSPYPETGIKHQKKC